MAVSKYPKTLRLTVAQALVKYIQVQYSERDGRTRRFIPGMFGIFGHGNAHSIGQALGEYGQDLTFRQPCNEQSMVHTAAGFAKAALRNQALACTASIGPGSTNMITGAALATVNRLPVLLIAADYYATRYQGPVLQQIEHPISADVSVNDCFRPVSRFFDRISRPEQLLTALPEAMRVMTDPADTGAVTIAIPQDLSGHAYDYPAYFFEKRIWRIERRLPDPQRIKEAIAMLKKAKRPVIIAGGGAFYSEALDELQKFAEAFGIPVGETFAGKGAMRKKSELVLGGFGVCGSQLATKVVSKADLVVCVGTRLTDFSTGSQGAFNNPDVKFIGINVCGHDAFKQGALPVLADARLALQAMIRAGKAANIRPKSAYLREVAALKKQWENVVKREFRPTPGEAMSQAQLIGVFNEEAQPGDTIVGAAGSPPGDVLRIWDCTDGTKCHLEFGYSCMGYEIPAGLGVRMTQPKGEVYVFIGDGTYLMNPMELVTAMQEKLKITVLISENHGYQCIRQLQMWRTGRPFGTEFRARDKRLNLLEGPYVPIDFAKNAESMGARAWNVCTPDELRTALREARQEKRCCVIVNEIEPHHYLTASGCWWDVATAETSKHAVTKKARAAYEKERAKVQRFHY